MIDADPGRMPALRIVVGPASGRRTLANRSGQRRPGRPPSRPRLPWMSEDDADTSWPLGSLRPAIRARLLRRLVRRQHQGRAPATSSCAPGLVALTNLDHRGATGAEADTGDGAGILVQIPDRFLRGVVDVELPPAGAYAVGHRVPARRRRRRREGEAAIEAIVGEEGLDVARLARRARRRRAASGRRAGGDAGVQAALRQPTRRAPRASTSTARCSSPASASSTSSTPSSRRTSRRCRRARSSTRGCSPRRSCGVLPRPHRRALRERAAARAQPLLDQHVPVVAARPPVPLHRPQRRDQHRAGQPELDARPRGDGRRARCCPDLEQGVPDLHARGVRHRPLRRGARAAPPRRAPDPPRRADDDPGGVGEQRRDGRRPAGVLPLPRLADGAVGRPGQRRRSPTAPSSAPCSTATACARAATGSPTTTSSSWRPRSASSTSTRPRSSARAGCSPGRMFLIDTAEGRIVDDEEIKTTLAAEHPYAEWLDEGLVELDDLPDREHVVFSHDSVLRRQQMFGYTHEELKIIVAPMALKAASSRSARWAPTRRSPCCRTGRGCCSTTSRSCSPRSPTRRSTPSARRSSRRSRRPSARRPTCSQPGPESCRQLALPFPIIDNDELAKIIHANDDGGFPGLAAHVVKGLYRVAGGGAGARAGARGDLRRGVGGDRGRRPRHRAVRPQLRPRSRRRSRRCCSPRPCTTTSCAPSSARWSGSSSSAATPARCTTWRCSSATAPARSTRTSRSSRSRTSSPSGMHGLGGIDPHKAVRNYIKACGKGVLKVMSKMGISTVASYTGAQIFEAIGLGEELVERYFTGTVSRLGGIGLDEIAAEVAARHAIAYPTPARGAGPPQARARRRVPVAARGRVPPVQPGDRVQAAARHAGQALRHLQGVHRGWSTTSRRSWPRCAACSRFKVGVRPAGRRSTRSSRSREIVKRFSTGRDVVRLDLGRGPRDAGDRDEPHRRQVEHRRGRRGRRPPARPDAALGDQAGRVGPLRRHVGVPHQRRRPADQDGPGRQARRGRPAAGPQGVPVDRQDPVLDAGRRPDQPAAAPRHLLDRGPQAADPRPQELQPGGARPRQARRRDGRRHGRRRRVARPRPTSC